MFWLLCITDVIFEFLQIVLQMYVIISYYTYYTYLSEFNFYIRSI